jgi:predicted DNA-binding transcriptional regulator AlpA
MKIQSSGINEHFSDYRSTEINSISKMAQLLRIAEVSSLTTLAKSTINLWEATGRFPKSIALSPTIKVWTLTSIMEWLEEVKK